LAVTRSLGHNRITYNQPEKHTIECSLDDKIKVLLFSDGVGDVIEPTIPGDLELLKTLSAEKIVDVAEKRWKQEWIYVTLDISDNYYIRKTQFDKDGYDDCCCVSWNYKP
jgi:hypothetical protein